MGVYFYLKLFIGMDCHYKSGDVIIIREGDELSPLKNPDCIIEQGVTIRFYVTEPVEEPAIDTEEENKNNIVPNKEVSEQVSNQKKEVPKMEPVQQQDQPIQQPQQEAPQTAPVVVAAPQPVQTVATTTAAPEAPFDVNQLITSTGGGGTIAVVLALVAVVGGGAAWKFYQKFSEQKHEQAMKKLEIEAQYQGLNGTQPPPCQAANAAIEARLVAMDAKLASVEKKTSSFSAGFDADDIEERIIKLEKKLKSTAGRPAKEV
jgi:hypothetical protein